MYFLLADMIHRFIYLKIGLALVLIWVGIKMLIKIDIYYIPTPLSLAVIATIIGVSIGVSLWATRGQERRAPEGPAHSPFGSALPEKIAALEPLWLKRAGKETTSAPKTTVSGKSDAGPHAPSKDERK